MHFKKSTRDGFSSFSVMWFLLLTFIFITNHIQQCSCDDHHDQQLETSRNIENINPDAFDDTSPTTDMNQQTFNQSENDNNSSATGKTDDDNDDAERTVTNDQDTDSASKDLESLIRYNCTPVQGRETAQLIVIDSNGIPAYPQLKSYVTNLFYLNNSTQEQPSSSVNNNNSNNYNNNNNNNNSSDGSNGTTTTTETTNSSNSNQNDGQCAIMIFYYNWCRYSAAAAPQFNAIGRLYPQMFIIAVDAYHHYSVTIRFGVSGVPSIYFLYNGRPVAKYNRTDITIDGLVDFIRSLTLMDPIIKGNSTASIDDSSTDNGTDLKSSSSSSLNVTESDLQGPLVISLNHGPDYLLIFCSIFCLMVFLYHFLRSTLFHKIKEHVRNMWNEAQTVQHEHVD